jgi:hypothetical protein
MLKLRCNKRSAYTEKPTPPSSKRRHHFETRTCLGQNNNLVIDLEETEDKNDCAGECQQQFNGPNPVSVRPESAVGGLELHY